MEKLTCPYCDSTIPANNYESHITAHETSQNDEEYAKMLAAQEEQALNEAAALKLVETDVANKEKYDMKSPLSALVTTPEQIAQMALAARTQTTQTTHAPTQSAQTAQDDAQKHAFRGPTAADVVPQFLAYVDRTHAPAQAHAEHANISHVVLFDIDNCGGEFEQIADAFPLFPDMLVYVVGGPGLPNVSNTKLPLLSEMHQQRKLHIIPMTKKGKNAADFVLSFYGGMLHERLPLHIPFVIVSRDKGLTQLVEHVGLLGRAAQLISNDIIKHLSLKPTAYPQNTPTTNTDTNPNSNSNTTATTSTTSTSAVPSTLPQLAAANNPFIAESGSTYTIEQAVWFIVSSISKVDANQRPKTRAKLENTISGFVKRIPGEHGHLAVPLLIEEMQRQNFIFLDNSRVNYFF